MTVVLKEQLKNDLLCSTLAVQYCNTFFFERVKGMGHILNILMNFSKTTFHF